MTSCSGKSSILNDFSVEFLSDEDCQILKKRYYTYHDGALRLNPGGWIFPGKYLEHAHHILEFDYSEEDIIVMTCPKSGTTWMIEIVWNLINNPDQNNPHSCLSSDFRCPEIETANIFTVGDKIFEMDFEPYKNLFDQVFPGCRRELENSDILNSVYGAFADMPRPRVLKIHHPIPLLPKNVLKKTKIVYVARNLYDVVNSRFHFLQRFLFGSDKVTLDEYVDDFTADKVPFGPYFQHMKEAWDRRDDPNFLFLFYEDLKQDPVKEIKKVDRFIGTNRTDDQIERVAKFTSFESLKKRFKNNEPTSNNLLFQQQFFNKKSVKEEGSFFRKGEVGDWKNNFNESQMEKLKKYAEKNLKMFGEDFKYNQNSIY